MTRPKKVADADKGNWIEPLLPNWAVPYIRLSRADRATGTWLLLIPCWLGILLACGEKNNGGLDFYDAWLLVACVVGAFLMRGAGCTWNDIMDKDYDKLVARTKLRPLAAQQVSIKQALVWMMIQSVLALGVLMTFNALSIFVALCSIFLVLIYPLAKRFTWWPQVFLGLAFNWGILVGYSASKSYISLSAYILYAAGVFWTLFYDTIYALQDVDDDKKVGIKSTALLFGKKTKSWLVFFSMAFCFLTSFATYISPVSKDFQNLTICLGGIIFMSLHLIYQIHKLEVDSKCSCLATFKSNKNTGLILVGSFLLVCLF